MEILMDAGKQGHSQVEIEFDPAKVLGIGSDKGKFIVVIAAGESMDKLKAALETAKTVH